MNVRETKSENKAGPFSSNSTRGYTQQRKSNSDPDRSTRYDSLADSFPTQRSHREYRERSPLRRRVDAEAVQNLQRKRRNADASERALREAATRRPADYFSNGWSQLEERGGRGAGRTSSSRQRERSASPGRAGRKLPTGFTRFLAEVGSERDLERRMRGFNLGDNDDDEKKVGRKKGQLKSRVDRIYEI